MKLRASDLAALFEVYMLGVALAALKTALDAHGSWFSETASFWVYSMTFLASVVLLSVTGAAAVFLGRTTGLEAGHRMLATTGVGPPGQSREDEKEADIDELLSSLERGGANPGAGSLVTEVKRSTPGKMIRVARAPSAPGGAARIQLTLLGPSIAAGVFCALSAAFLSAVTAFQTQYTINNLAILTLSYGWGGLVFYTIASLFLAGRLA